jgi:DNA-binding CsgD family transcriptional regulator
MVPIENFPTGFQQEALRTINRLLPLSSSIFALVDPSIRNSGMVLQNMDIETDNEYQTFHSRQDPLHPYHFKESAESVVCLDDLLTEEEIFQTVYYRDFMLPHHMRYVTDIFLRRDGIIIAFLSLIRDHSMGNFARPEIELLRNLQPLLEFSLNSIYKPQRINELTILSDKFQLTPREIDVIEQIIAGSSNQSIADNLYLSLSTIKTHLQHIFRKMAVASRTELLTKTYRSIQ